MDKKIKDLPELFLQAFFIDNVFLPSLENILCLSVDFQLENINQGRPGSFFINNDFFLSELSILFFNI